MEKPQIQFLEDVVLSKFIPTLQDSKTSDFSNTWPWENNIIDETSELGKQRNLKVTSNPSSLQTNYVW